MSGRDPLRRDDDTEREADSRRERLADIRKPRLSATLAISRRLVTARLPHLSARIRRAKARRPTLRRRVPRGVSEERPPSPSKNGASARTFSRKWYDIKHRPGTTGPARPPRTRPACVTDRGWFARGLSASSRRSGTARRNRGRRRMAGGERQTASASLTTARQSTATGAPGPRGVGFGVVAEEGKFGGEVGEHHGGGAET